MSSQSDNSTWLENLIQSNAQTMEAIEETPYQPIVYAVPKEWLEGWMKLLQQAVQFQPTLYQMIAPLATRQELERMLTQQRQIQQETLKEIRNTLQQDGKMREQFSSDTSKMLSDSLGAMEDMSQRLERRILKRVALASSILSAALSVLACGVLLHWAGQ